MSQFKNILILVVTDHVVERTKDQRSGKPAKKLELLHTTFRISVRLVTFRRFPRIAHLPSEGLHGGGEV